MTSDANDDELIHHRVDGVLQLENFASDIDRDLLRKIAIGHGVVTSAMLRTWLVRFEAIEFTLSVRSFQVPATPFTSACPPSFPSVPTSRATRVTSDANDDELIHHRVDGVLQLENFAPDIDRDLLRQVAIGDGGGHFGDVTHLGGQVARHEVHVVGQILPGAADAFHIGLAAEFSFGTDFAGHARHFRCERS